MANLFERDLQELKQSGRFAQLELQLKTRIDLRAPGCPSGRITTLVNRAQI